MRGRRLTMVVGNAPIQNDLGGFIDQFPRVIRINTYRIEGFKKSVGSRCTDWLFLGNRIEEKLQLWSAANLLRKTRGVKRVLIRCQPWHVHPVHLELYRIFGIPRRNLFIVAGDRTPDIIPKSCRLWPDPDLHRKVIKRLEAMPTTGLMAIMLALEHYCDPPVYISCFGPKNGLIKGHYYTSGGKLAAPRAIEFTQPRDKSLAHDFHRERELINEWEEAGLVKRCDV